MSTNLSQRINQFTIIALIAMMILAGTMIMQPQNNATADTNPQETALRTITVVGNGSVVGEPNVANVSVGVEVLNEDVEVGVEEANTRIEAVTQALIGLGIEASNIQTSNYNIYQERREFPMEMMVPSSEPASSGVAETGQPQMMFRVSIMVNVKVTQIERIGEVISESIGAGANMVNNIGFNIEDAAELNDEARINALNDAETRANQIAAEMGLTITGVQSVTEHGGNGGIVTRNFGYDMVENASISTGSVRIDSSVQVTYTFE